MTRLWMTSALSIALTASPTFADVSTLQFDVQLGPDTASRPLSGRLWVVLQKQGPRRGEPRMSLGRTGLDTPPVLGRDVTDFEPGQTAVLNASSAIFPIPGLDALPPGPYRVQAVLHTNRDLNIPNAPGDYYSPIEEVVLDPARGGRVSLRIDRRLPEESMPADSPLVRYVKIRSNLLSNFHHRPIFLRASVVLPRGFNDEPQRRYPLRVHIGGYGSRFTQIPPIEQAGSSFHRLWMSDDTPRFLYLTLDGAGPLGDPYQVNSDNHGPYGDAITTELIPEVERRFRGIGTGQTRVLDGGSTGGWVSLALQTFYPDFFNGAWAFCPDSVDFRSFQLVNIYHDSNAYLSASGFERPSAREPSGDVRYTMRHELQMENVLGREDSWAMSGGQWGAWNATYGPKAPDGQPVPLWDPKTGAIDRSVVDHWKRYDLRLYLQSHWADLAPQLKGKIHIWVGEADDYFLNNAVHRLDNFLQTANPPFEGSITYGPGAGHCWSNLDEADLLRQMAQAVGAQP